MPSKKVHILSILKVLHRDYPQSGVSLKYKNPFQLLIVTILSAQCTDVTASRVADCIFKKYKTPTAFSKARLAIFEKEISQVGLYKSKAKNIIASSKIIAKKYNSKIPQSMSELVQLPGVGRKTANIILSTAFKKQEGIAVDTHVKRISRRLGLTTHLDPNKIEQDLIKIIPYKEWLYFNNLLVNHGRKICNAKSPLCCDCNINKYCPFKRCRK